MCGTPAVGICSCACDVGTCMLCVCAYVAYIHMHCMHGICAGYGMCARVSVHLYDYDIAGFISLTYLCKSAGGPSFG